VGVARRRRLLAVAGWSSGVAGHVAVKNAAAIMGQYEKHLKNLEADCGHGEEINGNQLRDVVLWKVCPD
jgi:hypothetical protein